MTKRRHRILTAILCLCCLLCACGRGAQTTDTSVANDTVSVSSGADATQEADTDASSGTKEDADISADDEDTGTSGTGITQADRKRYDFTTEALSLFETLCEQYPVRDCLASDGDHDDCRNWIVSTIRDAGYDASQIELQNVTGTLNGETIEGKNVILTVEGADPSRQIIAGAHYDGDGAGDNASGCALLLSAICGLQGQTPDVTVHYIFFDQEEIGRFGSKAYAARMSDKEAAATVLMINIDAVAFGDYCNVYGGRMRGEDVVQTEAYELAMEYAKLMDINVYDTDDLDGYYELHGEGPVTDDNGLFTNPWTAAHPAPTDTVYDEIVVYSPTTIPYSDHLPFSDRDIPYVYFEATNWFAKGDDPDLAFSGYYETTDTTIGDHGMFMNTAYDTMANLNRYFPGRLAAHYHLYSPLLSALILHPVPNLLQ